jgi:hypothetical protein
MPPGKPRHATSTSGSEPPGFGGNGEVVLVAVKVVAFALIVVALGWEAFKAYVKWIGP